jgi:hypothetical protein
LATIGWTVGAGMSTVVTGTLPPVVGARGLLVALP